MGFPTPSAGGGWLGLAYDPFPLVRNQMMSASPKWEGEFPLPQGLALPLDVSASRLSDRRALLTRIDGGFTSEHQDAGLVTLDAHEQKGFELLLAPEARSAFDLKQEPTRVRDRYGRSEMGQVLLLSRRLIEAGVRFVTANAVSDPPRKQLASFQIWDTHFEHFRLYDSYLMHELDQGLSALISDLDERGLLAETIVLVMGEFGRTPKINDNDGGGRDHWPHAYSVLWAGGGARAGQVIGSTDQHAAFVKDRPLKPDDLSATLYEALGFPHDTRLVDISGRPRPISEGTPIRELLG
jgi:arylsulfatase A-like enzyme